MYTVLAPTPPLFDCQQALCIISVSAARTCLDNGHSAHVHEKRAPHAICPQSPSTFSPHHKHAHNLDATHTLHAKLFRAVPNHSIITDAHAGLLWVLQQL